MAHPVIIVAERVAVQAAEIAELQRRLLERERENEGLRDEVAQLERARDELAAAKDTAPASRRDGWARMFADDDALKQKLERIDAARRQAAARAAELRGMSWEGLGEPPMKRFPTTRGSAGFREDLKSRMSSPPPTPEPQAAAANDDAPPRDCTKRTARAQAEPRAAEG